jgi:hypothetical protein
MKSIKSFFPMLLIACTLAACAANPWAYAKTPLDKAHVALSSLEIVQTAALKVVTDASTPPAVKAAIKTASRDATLAAVQLGNAVIEVENARAELVAAGPNGAARLQVATNKLVEWTTTVMNRIESVKAAIKEAKHHGT